ncbi:MAG: flavin-containing monooxygenase, partial [Hypericibacter sp.]
MLAYMGEVIAENDLGGHIRYRHAVSTASWSSESNRWTVTCRRGDTGEAVAFTAKFLWMCQGYYNHAEGYMPTWPGMERFGGPIIHPQNWPEELDYRGKEVVVIGSGATAATIIPAMAPDCRHITMLQRSPTYFHASPNTIPLADELRRLEIKEAWIHEIVRQKILHDDAAFERRTFDEPEIVKAELLGVIRAHLGEDYDVDTHFTPRYRPWRQRLAVIPEGDLLKAIRAGKASVVTDEIDSFTETGIILRSGRELAADIVVAATGLTLCVFGDIEFVVDG